MDATHKANDPLINFAGGLKILGSGKRYGKDEGVRVGGFGVLFTEPGDLDLDGQFFSKDTDFWLMDETESTVWPIYGHGMDPTLGTRRFSDTPWTVKQDDAGLWIEGQIQIADEYDEMLVEEGIRTGKMGLSSGAVSHLVRVSQAESGKGEHIDQWPIYEESITPQPSEYRTKPGLEVGKSLSTSLYHLSGLDIPPLKSFLGVQPEGRTYRPTARIDAEGKEASLNDRIDMIRHGFFEQHDPDDDMRLWVEEVFDDRVIVHEDQSFFSVSYTGTPEDDNLDFAARTEWTEVAEQTEWIPIDDESDDDASEGESGDDDMEGMAAFSDFADTAKQLEQEMSAFEAETELDEATHSLKSMNKQLARALNR
jgi:hypothetical protein